MGYLYAAAWDTRETPMAVAVGGAATGTATLTEGPISHAPAASSGWEGAGAMSLAVELEACLDALAAGFTVALSTSTYLYTISHASTFTLTFTGEAGENLRKALGFSGNKSGANSYTSDVRPYYLIDTYLDAWSQVSDLYEPDEDVVQEATADDGTPFAVARDSDELWSDWTQPHEIEAAVYERHASASVPWTWQAFFKHCRGTHRFKVYEDFAAGTSLGVYMLRAEGATFSRRTRARVVEDWRDRHNITLLTRWIQAA